MRQKLWIATVAAAILLTATVPSWGKGTTPSDLQEAARAVLAKRQAAVVRVGAVLTTEVTGAPQSMPARDQEVFGLGLVVDKATGLTVVPASLLDPLGGPMEVEPQPGMNITVTTVLTDVWLELADGTRLPAKRVLEDHERDIAFLYVVDATPEKLKSLAAVGPEEKAGRVAIAGPVIGVDRLEPRYGQAPRVFLSHIEAMVDKPERAYVVNSQPGVPVFSASGAPIGLTVARLGSTSDIDPKEVMQSVMRGGAVGRAVGTAVVLPWSAIVGPAKLALTKAQAAASEGK